MLRLTHRVHGRAWTVSANWSQVIDRKTYQVACHVLHCQPESVSQLGSREKHGQTAKTFKQSNMILLGKQRCATCRLPNVYSRCKLQRRLALAQQIARQQPTMIDLSPLLWTVLCSLFFQCSSLFAGGRHLVRI
jgi:hypothetical protein